LEEFLREYYGLLTKSVEVIAAIVAIIVYKKYRNTSVKFFLWFLIYVAFVELIGNYPRYVYEYDYLKPLKEFLSGTFFKQNYWWYNIFWTIASAVFYSFYFIKILKTKRFKVIIKICVALFFISVILKIAIDFKALFNSLIVFNTVFGASIIIICTILYFMEVLKSEKILTFYRSINFFIATIIFIWFLVVTPLVFYNVYFSKDDWDFIILKSVIILSMNVFMYLTFSFALLWCKPQNV